MSAYRAARRLALCTLALSPVAGAQAAHQDASHPLIRHVQQVQARTAGAVVHAPLPRPAGFESWLPIDRDDYEATELDVATSAETLCTAGARSSRFHRPAEACRAATRAALDELDFESAYYYAHVGCARHGDAANCRAAAGVPVLMGKDNHAPPRSLAVRLQALAETVCSPAGRVADTTGRDVTARECAYLARQFVRARDPQDQLTISRPARAFHAALYDRGRAIRLMAGACNRGDGAVCEEKYELGRQMDGREMDETRAIDDAQAGEPIPVYANAGELERGLASMARKGAAVLAARQAHIIASADLDDLTEAEEQEAGDRVRAAAAGRLCMAAARTTREESARACRLAFQHARETAQFDLALGYATAGCERHRDAASCRFATHLPLQMIEHRVTPAPRFASELRRLGKAVCLGGVKVTNLAGGDVTGRICNHYASLLTPGYPVAAAYAGEGVERYLATVHDAASARALHQAACRRHAYHDSCGIQVTGAYRAPNGQSTHAH